MEYFEYVSRSIATYANRSEGVMELIDSVSIELMHIYESSDVDKEFIMRCYELLFNLAKQCRCEKSFIYYLEDKYMRKFRSNRRLRKNTASEEIKEEESE